MAEQDLQRDLEQYAKSYDGHGPHQRNSAQMSHRTNADVIVYGGARRSFILTPDSHISSGEKLASLDDDVLEEARRKPVAIASTEAFTNGWNIAEPIGVFIDLLETPHEAAYVAKINKIGEVSRSASLEQTVQYIGENMVSRLQELRNINGSLGRRKPLLEAFEAILVSPAEPQS